MTGSLQAKKGLYYAVLSHKDDTGKWRTKWVCLNLEEKGNNKRKAQEKLKEILSEYETKKDVSILFLDYMREWLEVIKKSVEKNTLESYADIINRYIPPYFNKHKIILTELKPADIQDFYKELLEKVSPNTVIKLHANIRKALTHATKMGYIPFNPAEKVVLPKKKKYAANFLTAEQIKELLENIKDDPIYPLVYITVLYGLRRSEILGLKWNAINFKTGLLTIKDTVVQYKTFFDKEDTKNKTSNRSFHINEDSITLLKNLKEKQENYEAILGNTYIKNDYVFKKENGEVYRPDYVTKRFKKLIEKIGLPKIRFHDLRHSTASLLIANGHGLKEIQEYMGHGDIGTTANIYAHLLFQSKKDMTKTLQEKIAKEQRDKNIF